MGTSPLLVDRIIALGWRLRRLCYIEAGIFEHCSEDSPLYRFPPSDGASLTYGKVFLQVSVNSNSFSTLSRYESRMERSLFRSLHELERLQEARKGEPVPAPQAVDIEVTGVPELPGTGDERD
jgi:hypothetical protein